MITISKFGSCFQKLHIASNFRDIAWFLRQTSLKFHNTSEGSSYQVEHTPQAIRRVSLG